MRSTITSCFIIFFLCFCSLAHATCSDDKPVTLADDAYQYNSTFNPWSKDYKEWWFFTFADPETKIAMCMGYYGGLSDKMYTNISAGIGGMFWPNFQQDPNNIQYVTDNSTTYSVSKQNATMSTGKYDSIRVIDVSTYVITGQSASGNLQWNLTYHQTVPGMREIFEFTFLELNWMSYMPIATVQGEITYNGNTIPVKGQGYHDHNWGVWPASIFNWVWAQYGDNSQDFAIVMGAYKVLGTHEYIGYVFLRWDGVKSKIGTLCGDSYSLVPLKFEEWNGHKYSVQNQVQVKGKDWWLEVNYTTITSGVNPGGVGLNLLVFEQISQFNVTLSQNDAKGGWKQVVVSSGTGFNEWSDVITI